MPTITFVQPGLPNETLDIAPGATVMSAAIGHGIDGILAECGGHCMCATCHVYVDETHLALLPPMTGDEDALLDGTASDRRPTSRLACQITITPALDGLVVQVPERQA